MTVEDRIESAFHFLVHHTTYQNTQYLRPLERKYLRIEAEIWIAARESHYGLPRAELLSNPRWRIPTWVRACFQSLHTHRGVDAL